MGKKKKKKDPKDAKNPGFGLNEPTGQFDDLEEKLRKKAEAEKQVPPIPLGKQVVDDELTYKNMGWKGIDAEEEEEAEKEVEFEKEPIPEDELDMTPMVDVTFLLLIFFMVTASFTLIKSLEQPPAQSDQPSTNVQEKEEIVDDYVQVTIDQTNTFYVTTRDEEETECPSDNEMRARVKDAKATTSATRLIILAHVDSTHAKVITAWDAGVVNDMEQIEIQTTDEDF
jgi:biopolymer transport protein ExbD